MQFKQRLRVYLQKLKFNLLKFCGKSIFTQLDDDDDGERERAKQHIKPVNILMQSRIFQLDKIIPSTHECKHQRRRLKFLLRSHGESSNYIIIFFTTTVEIR